MTPTWAEIVQTFRTGARPALEDQQAHHHCSGGSRGLCIGARMVSIVELLRSDWTRGISAGVAWLVFLQWDRRLPPPNPKFED